MKNRIDFHCEYKAKGDNSGKFTGYASVFGEMDYGYDIVMPGAFTNFIAEQKASGRPIQLWREHDRSRLIGVVREFSEDSKGFHIEGELTLGVRDADEAYLLMKAEALTGISYGYKTVKSHMRENGVRELHEVKMSEISLVSQPMLDSSRVEKVKSIGDLMTVRDCEDWLRDAAGLSSNQAKSFIARVKASKNGQRDVDLTDVQKALSILRSE